HLLDGGVDVPMLTGQMLSWIFVHASLPEMVCAVRGRITRHRAASNEPLRLANAPWALRVTVGPTATELTAASDRNAGRVDACGHRPDALPASCGRRREAPKMLRAHGSPAARCSSPPAYRRPVGCLPAAPVRFRSSASAGGMIRARFPH